MKTQTTFTARPTVKERSKQERFGGSIVIHDRKDAQTTRSSGNPARISPEHCTSFSAPATAPKVKCRRETLIAPALALAAMIAGSSAHAQLATAEVEGTVHDTTAALLPGATVQAKQLSTGILTTEIANKAGIFVFSALPVGSYLITVTATGFTTYRETGLVLTVGEHRTLDVGLAVGTTDTTVTVEAAAASIDSTTPTEQSIISQKVVQGLPLNGRNPADLEFTVAGVTNAALNIRSSDSSSTIKESDAVSPSSSAPSVHGARPGGTYFSLDGATNTDPFSVIGGPFPNPDATGEFNVVTGTYGAQYVSAPGGAVNIVMRSGSNQFHGTAFEFLRNGYVNARNRFAPTPDILKRNQYGFALGGPVLHDKVFFFTGYQATPIRTSNTSVGFFPTAPQRTGDFGTFKIPAAMLSPAIQKALQFIPVGAPGTGVLNYQVGANSNDTQGVAKFDFDVAKHRVFVRGFYDRYVLQSDPPTGPALVAGEAQGQVIPWLSLAAGDNWSLGAFTLQTTASYTRALATSTKAANTFSFNNLGINNLTGTPGDPGFSLLYVLGAFAVGNGSISQFPRSTFEVSQNAFVIKGKDQLSFGINYRRLRLDEANATGQNPIAVFIGLNSFLDGQYGIIPGATFNATADFLLGQPFTYFQQDGFYSNQRANLFWVYSEDSYKLSKNLTLTAGLRWDPYLPDTPQAGHITCFEPSFQSTLYTNAPKGLAFSGDPGCPASGVNSKIALFEPRVGLAYAVGDSGKMVVRAGYGRYDLQIPLNAYTGFSAQPFVRTLQTQQAFTQIENVYGSLGIANPFAGGFQTGTFVPAKNVPFIASAAASTLSPSFRPGYIQQWSLSTQQLLTSRDSVDVAYVGTEGTHLLLGVNLNTPLYNASEALAVNQTNEQMQRPYPNFATISELSSIGTSNYNGVDVTYRHITRTFTLNSAFTWSKSLDDNSRPVNAGQVNNPFGYNHFQRGRSDFDQNFLFRNTFTYSAPEFKNLNRFARAAIGSWGVSGLIAFDAGAPFSVTDTDDRSATNTGLDLADRVPNQPVYENGQLNINAFTGNAPGTFGNSGKNVFRSPSSKQVDVALLKSFPIKDRFNGTFRFEAFNVINHPNLYPPAAVYGGPGTTQAANFGTINGARDPRILQASLKLSF